MRSYKNVVINLTVLLILCIIDITTYFLLSIFNKLPTFIVIPNTTYILINGHYKLLFRTMIAYIAIPHFVLAAIMWYSLEYWFFKRKRNME
jgi:hypothetical protein